jgi:hypothetical protein
LTTEIQYVVFGVTGNGSRLISRKYSQMIMPGVPVNSPRHL